MSRRAGFSLIELLIVLVIMGVLAAAALPSWQRHVVAARRSEAQAMLLKLMLQQERYFTQTGTYLAFSAGTEGVEQRQFQWWSGASPAASAYEIEGQPCEGEPISQCVRLVATPGTARVDAHFRDDDCRQLTLTSSGERQAAGRQSQCWR